MLPANSYANIPAICNLADRPVGWDALVAGGERAIYSLWTNQFEFALLDGLILLVRVAIVIINIHCQLDKVDSNGRRVLGS